MCLCAFRCWGVCNLLCIMHSSGSLLSVLLHLVLGRCAWLRGTANSLPEQRWLEVTAVLTVCGMSPGAGVVSLAGLRFSTVGVSTFRTRSGWWGNASGILNMASLLLPSEIPEKCMSRCKTYPANLRTPGASFLLWKVYSDLSDHGWFAVLREARNELSGWGCGRALAAVRTLVQPRATMWCDAHQLQPHWARFPAGSLLCRMFLGTSLKPAGAFPGVGEMGCCLSSPSSGKPHGVVPHLLQVLCSRAISKCI